MDPKKYEAGDLHWLHKAISNLKAFLIGTYHGRCTKLQAYLDEYCFRFNRRMTGDQIFLRLRFQSSKIDILFHLHSE